MEPRKIVVGVTGASGSVYASRLLKKLTSLPKVETALVMSDNARQVWELELGNTDYKDLKLKTYDKKDFMAPFASGSSSYDTLIVCPCSMGTLGRIAQGISNDLLTRAADVMLKERKRLILVPRETPYNLIHIRNLETVTLAGGIICPASPSFYSQPKSFEELADTVVDRLLDLSGLKIKTYRWKE